MRSPSTNLLGAILRPVATCPALTRASSTGHNVSLLDKLHRRQKKALREERLASVERAKSNPTLTSRAARIATIEPTPTSDPSQPTTPTAITTTTDPPKIDLPYTITRTRPGHQLPIYTLSKGGGTKHLTKVRKISGDLNALKEDLTKALGLEAGLTNKRGEKVEGASINWQTNHVIVRGWRGPEIKAWAEAMGF